MSRNDLVCPGITCKNLMTLTIFYTNFPIETNHTPTQKNEHTFKQSFLYQVVLVQPGYVSFRKNLWFCVQFIRAYPRNLITICKKMPSDWGNLSIHILFRGISPKILFCDGLYMIAFFHEDLAREYEKLVGYT